jgi:hypothetical protein
LSERPIPRAGGRRIVGNLLFESELARAFPAREGLRPRSTQSRSALEAAAAYGTLLRSFARDDDCLWLPAPLDPARVLEVPGLPRPYLESGALRRLPPCGETLAWGESVAVAGLRAQVLVAEAGAPPDGNLAPLHELLWRLSPASPRVVARVHHRAFALEVAREIGCALPGAAMVASLDELERHLRAGAAPEGRWVVKAPLSASGRERYVERGASLSPNFGEATVRRRIAGLFAHHGELAFEPWMERSDDFGACALLTPSGLRILGFHRLLVDLRGQLAGIEVAGGAGIGGACGLTRLEGERFTATLELVGAALARAGYSGPFGIDAWRYRSRSGTRSGPPGSSAFHPLGEINARLTFGFVARALGERLRAAGVLDTGRAFRLMVGRSVTADLARTSTIPLIAGPDGDTALAWIEAE